MQKKKIVKSYIKGGMKEETDNEERKDPLTLGGKNFNANPNLK